MFASTVRFPRYGRGSYLNRVSAVIARGKRPVPFRTRKLSLSAPMVLQGGPCGRVGRCRTFFREGPPQWGGPSRFWRVPCPARSPNMKAPLGRRIVRCDAWIVSEGVSATWLGAGADVGRLTRSRGMVNERQAIWWGIPARVFQRPSGVERSFGRIRPVGWQRIWCGAQQWWVSTLIVKLRQAAHERGIVVQRQAGVGFWSAIVGREACGAWVEFVRLRLAVLQLGLTLRELGWWAQPFRRPGTRTTFRPGALVATWRDARHDRGFPALASQRFG